MHTVEIYLDKSNLFRWRRRGHDGTVIAHGDEGYKGIASCHMAVFRLFGSPWKIDITAGRPGDLTGAAVAVELPDEHQAKHRLAEDPDGASW